VSLKSKVAVVTGGANGIGLATVRCLLTAGAQVIIADLNEAAGQAAEAGFDQAAGAVRFVRTDVTQLDSVTHLFDRTISTFGGVDILFNNAGVLGGPRFPEAGPSSWMKAIDINLVGVMNCIHVGVPHLVKRGGGVIVNTGSTAGLKSSFLDPAYAMTKAAVIGLTRSLTFLEAEAGIRVNCICPALVKTSLEANSGGHFTGADRKAFLDGRAGRSDQPSLSPDDVAEGAMRLIEDTSLNGVALKLAVGEPPELIASVAPQKV
jgi:NAD(P)-dependent dehydrogenase (short-subunit alcohol dehydrogenase family)